MIGLLIIIPIYLLALRSQLTETKIHDPHNDSPFFPVEGKHIRAKPMDAVADQQPDC
jgi:hypothetical protein